MKFRVLVRVAFFAAHETNAAKKIAAGAIAADGAPLTEGWRTLADETSLLLASNDPAQVSRAIERLHAGTALVARLAEGGVSDSYNQELSMAPALRRAAAGDRRRGGARRV